jgi:hypothetical protein
MKLLHLILSAWIGGGGGGGGKGVDIHTNTHRGARAGLVVVIDRTIVRRPGKDLTSFSHDDGYPGINKKKE